MKVLRRIRWVSASLFEDIVAGRMDTARISGGLASGEYRAEGQALARNGEGLPNLVEAELDRNGIDPLSGAVREGLLFTSRVLAAGGGGYYCLVRPRHPGAGQRIAAAFRLLADRGVGGDSSVGRGHFSVTIEEGEPFHAPADGQVLCTLALFHPTAEDLSHLAARREWVRCSLEMRRGRLEQMYAHHARIWKPRLLYLSEGSFFPPAGNREVYGSAPVVLEEPFRVRQNGFAFPVRMRHAVPL
jgi:CRISPR-associated protein Csm4